MTLEMSFCKISGENNTNFSRCIPLYQQVCVRVCLQVTRSTLQTSFSYTYTCRGRVSATPADAFSTNTVVGGVAIPHHTTIDTPPLRGTVCTTAALHTEREGPALGEAADGVHGLGGDGVGFSK